MNCKDLIELLDLPDGIYAKVKDYFGTTYEISVTTAHHKMNFILIIDYNSGPTTLNTKTNDGTLGEWRDNMLRQFIGHKEYLDINPPEDAQFSSRILRISESIQTVEVYETEYGEFCGGAPLDEIQNIYLDWFALELQRRKNKAYGALSMLPDKISLGILEELVLSAIST